MKPIDARSGQEVTIGDTIVYDNGNVVDFTVDPPQHRNEPPGWYRILEVRDHLFSAQALIEGNRIPKQWLPLKVQMTHPEFFMQRVAFVTT